jgi:membrane-bound lytic murein transglycosylase B
MNSRRRALSAAAIAIAALTTAACGGSQETDTQVEVEITGEPVTLNEELTALCTQVVEQGLPPDAASALAEASGYAFTIIEEGDPVPTQPTDVVFTTRDDVVFACTPG